MSHFPALRLAASNPIPLPTTRRGVTVVELSGTEHADADVLNVFGSFAVVLRENHAVVIDGVTHLLPAHRRQSDG